MSVFDDVKQALNIRQVVEHYGYKVNRAGQFICPFHNDTRPSASIKKDYFNCFVCGAGGDVITFTARLHGLKNYDACKKLDSDFSLGLTNQHLTAMDKLRIDREKAKRQAELKRREELEQLIQRTGSILADYHRYLWQGLQFYPYNHKRHIRALWRLEEAQYFLECYDDNPEEYSKNFRKLVDKIERRIHQWHNEKE